MLDFEVDRFYVLVNYAITVSLAKLIVDDDLPKMKRSNEYFRETVSLEIGYALMYLANALIAY